MKIPFKYKNIHNCEAVVLSCIDFRFWKETVEFIENELNIKNFDFPSLPGGAKAINECTNEGNLPFSCIGVPINLHHAKKVIVMNHQDCGAYGGSAKFNDDGKAEQEFHKKELEKAKDKLLAKYPGKEVILTYAKLDDNKENIEFIIFD